MTAPLLVCARLDDMPFGTAGSREERCRGCGAPIWVSPEGRGEVERHGARPTCLPCIARSGNLPDKIVPAEGAIEGVRRELRRRQVGREGGN